MKRTNMPNFWPVSRKNKKFVIEPMPGPHSKDSAVPLGLLIRGVFGIARNMKEVKKVLNTGKIELNGRVCKEYKMPVGLMDILQIGSDTYRVVPLSKGLKPIKITDNDARLVKIKNKIIIGKNKIQLNMHNGYNVLVEKDNYNTGDSLLLDNKTGSIKKHIKFAKGVLVIITNGTNIGKIGNVEAIHESKNMQSAMLTIAVGKNKIIVPEKYVLVVGESSKPVIELVAKENNGD